MHIGFGSYAFRWALGHRALRIEHPLTLTDLVDHTARFGGSLLQIADSAELDSTDSQTRARLAKQASEAGVRLQTGASGATVPRLLKYLEISIELQADVLRIVLDGNDANPSLSEAESVLCTVAPSFEEAGVAIAIENHFLTASSDLVGLVENVASPVVGVCLDTANSIMAGEWPTTTVRLLAHHATSVHLKDYAVVPDMNGVGGHVVGRPLGEGWLDITGVLGAVRPRDDALGGRLGVVLEHWCPLTPDGGETLEQERRWRQQAIEHACALVDVVEKNAPET